MFRLLLRNRRQQLAHDWHGSALELGRRPDAAAALTIDDPYVSRQHLRLAIDADGILQIDVLGERIRLPDGRVPQRGERVRIALPASLRIGHTRLDVIALPDSDAVDGLQRLPAAEPLTRGWIADARQAPPPATLAAWFATLLTVHSAAVGSDAFHAETARAVVELVGLDRGLVLLHRDGDWQVVARHLADGVGSGPWSRRVLDQVRAQARTFYRAIELRQRDDSLHGIDAVVAAPIVDAEGRVIGAVYGSRDLQPGGEAAGIDPLEAQLVQLLAATVGIGLARADRQAEAARQRVLLEQFASPEIARELERDPGLLEGREREITVLFCDLHEYSTLAERLDAELAYRLLGEVMDRLTEPVLAHGGVIVDYYGDGFVAMWNAPLDQPDHAARAAAAARALLRELPALNRQWQPQLGCALALGIGLHSGPARVGNAGSRRRLKYGPRGHTVNVASRVEAAGRGLGVSLLASAETWQRLPPAQAVGRRLCAARLPGLDRPVTLYELAPATDDADWQARARQYQQALEAAGRGAVAEALEQLAPLLAAPADRPAERLAERCRAGGDGAPDLWLFDAKK